MALEQMATFRLTPAACLTNSQFQPFALYPCVKVLLFRLCFLSKSLLQKENSLGNNLQETIQQ